MGIPGLSTTTDPTKLSSADLRRWREGQAQRHTEEAGRQADQPVQSWTQQEAQASLDEWLEVLVAAENAARVRRRGFCYRGNMELAQMLANKIGIDMSRFFHEHYEHLRDEYACTDCPTAT